MTKNFLDLMNEVAEIYDIEITENASMGGVFYKDEKGNLIKVINDEHTAIINDFCTPIGTDFSIGKAVYPIENALTWAA